MQKLVGPWGGASPYKIISVPLLLLPPGGMKDKSSIRSGLPNQTDTICVALSFFPALNYVRFSGHGKLVLQVFSSVFWLACWISCSSFVIGQMRWLLFDWRHLETFLIKLVIYLSKVDHVSYWCPRWSVWKIHWKSCLSQNKQNENNLFICLHVSES